MLCGCTLILYHGYCSINQKLRNGHLADSNLISYRYDFCSIVSMVVYQSIRKHANTRQFFSYRCDCCAIVSVVVYSTTCNRLENMKSRESSSHIGTIAVPVFLGYTSYMFNRQGNLAVVTSLIYFRHDGCVVAC